MNKKLCAWIEGVWYFSYVIPQTGPLGICFGGSLQSATPYCY